VGESMQILIPILVAAATGLLKMNNNHLDKFLFQLMEQLNPIINEYKKIRLEKKISEASKSAESYDTSGYERLLGNRNSRLNKKKTEVENEN
jgi:hypothetical protein